MVTDGSVPVERVGRAALRRSFRRRSLKRCAALFVSPVSPDSETRIGTAVWVPGTCRPPPLLGQAPGTTIAPSFALIFADPEEESGVSCKNIRLSSAGGNSLRRSRNWRADGDGCDGLHLTQVSRGGLKGLTVCSVGSEPW